MAVRKIRISVMVGLVRKGVITDATTSTKSLPEAVEILERVTAPGSSWVFRGVWPTEICLSHFTKEREDSIAQEQGYSFTSFAQEMRTLLEYLYWCHRLTGAFDLIREHFPEGDPKGPSALPVALLRLKPETQRSALNRFILERYGVKDAELSRIDTLPEERRDALVEEIGERWLETVPEKSLGEVVRLMVADLVV